MMKKIFGIVLLVIGALVLVACKPVETSIEATITVIDGGTTPITTLVIELEIEDEESEITGTINVVLLDASGTQITTRNLTPPIETETISFSGLIEGATYTVRVVAAVGRRSVVLLTQSVTLPSQDEILIETAEQFLAMRASHRGKYILANDIDFEDIEFTSPFASAFRGEFDGQGFTLSNITITELRNYTGIFSHLGAATITNLNIDNVQIGTEEEPLSISTQARVGILAGHISDAAAVIENVEIKNSHIYYSSVSTTGVFGGLIAGYNAGSIEDVRLIDSSINLTGLSYGIVKLGGAVGYLHENAALKQIASNADVTFALNVETPLRDRTFLIAVGGIVGDNNSRLARGIEDVYSTGNVTITELNYNTSSNTTSANYSVYLGGLVAISYGSMQYGFFGGSLFLEHEAGEHDENATKTFHVAGLIAFYASSRSVDEFLRVGDEQTITVTVSADALDRLRVSQTVAHRLSSGAIEAAVYGETHLVVNGESKAEDDPSVVLDTLGEFLSSEWLLEQYNNLYS